MAPLDGIRGVAIGLVISFHAVQEVFVGGAYGVDIFFVLSAFLITSVIWRTVSHEGRFSPLAFYIRRVSRLSPALLVTVLILSPVAAWASSSEESTFDGIWVSLTYLTGFSVAQQLNVPVIPMPFVHIWSLAVEEQFYLIWPPMAVFLLHRGPKKRLMVVMLALFGAVVVKCWSTRFLGPGQTYFLPYGHLPSLFIGVIAACIYTDKIGGGLSRPLLRSSGISLVSLCAIIACSVWIPSHSDPSVSVGFDLIPSTAAGFLILNVCLDSASPAARMLSWRALQWLGTRSYGIYLYHTSVLYLFGSATFGMSRRWVVLTSIAFGLLLSEVSFRLLEVPIRRWGRVLTRRTPRTIKRQAIDVD